MREEIIKALEELKTVCMTQSEGNKFLSLETYLCELNNGRTIKREKLLKNKQDGSAVIVYPLTKEGKTIIAIEPRVFTKGTVGIGFPAGYIEKGEEPVVAAKRELLEETGYASDELIHMGAFYQDQGCSGALNHYFLALNCKKVASQQLGNSEFIKYVFVSEDELNELVNNGYITGINSAYLIEKGKTFVRRRIKNE